MSLKNKEYWDALESKAALYEEFNKNYTDKFNRIILNSEFDRDPEMKPFYADEEFSTVAANIKKAAKPLLPLLEDLLKHLPESRDNVNAQVEFYLARMGINDKYELTVLVSVLLQALKKDLPEFLESGMGVPKERAARRAFKRFKDFKAEEEARRAEFEKTQEFRTQQMEVKLGIRDAIEYPEA